MRIGIAPRDVASAAITAALTRGGWGIAAVVLLLAAAGILDVFAARGAIDAAGGVVAWLAPVAAALVLLAARPGRLSAAAFLAIGTASTFGYAVTLLGVDEAFGSSPVYLLNRPAAALALVGAVSGTLLGGALWVAAGFVLGSGALLAAFAVHGLPPALGWGPTIVATMYLAILGALAVIRRRQRSRLPDIDALERETARTAALRRSEQRIAAVVHDVVLGDLAALQLTAPNLTDRERDRFRSDIERLERELELEAAPTQSLDEALYEIVREFQWRGLAVDLSGRHDALGALSPATRQSALDALRAALENVRRHSGAGSAEVFVDADDSVSITIVDHGHGFDIGTVPADRLGLRSSIGQRIESAGGSVRVWSSPGHGTSVVLTLPRETEAADESA